MKKELYILDVSGFIFRAYYALPPMTNKKGEATQALFGFIRSVLKLCKEKNPNHLIAVFDGPDNKQSRIELYEKYKANRTVKLPDLPEQLLRAKEFCEKMGIHHIEVSGVEADDTMGSIAKWAANEGHTVYICTSDKDLCQLVGGNIYLLNPWKENLIIDCTKVEELYGVPPNKIIDLLAMMGDSSDNIPGLPGIGPKTAGKLLEEFGSLDYLLAHPEKITGKKQQLFIDNKELVLLSRKLATIHLDVDFPKEESLFLLSNPDLSSLRAFYSEMGFTSLIKELDKLPSTKEENTQYNLVNDEKSLAALIELLKNEKEICFDVETDALDPIQATLVGIGFCVKPGESFYLPLNGSLPREKILSYLKELFESPSHSFYGHNVKYDCHVLETIGIHVKNLSFDTILASYLLNSAAKSHSLDELTLTYFDKVKTPIKELIGTGKKQISMFDVPLAQLADYCGQDVDYTYRLKQFFEKELHKENLYTLFKEMELPLLPILMKMERAGIAIDKEHLAYMSVEVGKEIESLTKKIFALAGEEFNINSPKQLSYILFEKLALTPIKKGTTHFSTAADILEKLAEEHVIAAEILVHRQLEKLKNTYIDALPGNINPKTGRIHPNFIQFGTSTGRLACQEPNLQNIPVRSALGKQIRAAFKPSDLKWSYLAADYSQIELRLLAHLSEDPALIKAFNAGEDIHTYTASLMFEVPLTEVSPVMRHQAKAINFGIIYGQGPFGLSQELRISPAKAKDFITAYFKRYTFVERYIENQIAFSHKNEYAITMFGRKRLLPEINSNNQHIQKSTERLAVNMPLQGSAADLIKLAMISIDNLLKEQKMRSFMVLQIHDELIFEAPDEELPILENIVRKGMEGVQKLKVPLIVDVKVGKNWGEC